MGSKKHLFNRYEFAKRIEEYPFEHYLENYYLNRSAVEAEKAQKASEFLELNDDVLLDIGCSLGFFSFSFSPKVKYVIGLDYELNSLKMAKKYLDEHGKHENVFFIQADAIRLPFKEGVFSKINNADFIEHIIPAKHCRVVKEMKRVLRPGGLILTYTPNWIRLKMEYYINKFKYALKGRHYGWQEDRPYKDKPELKNHQDTLLHVGLLNFYSLKKMFLKNNLAIKKISYNEWNIPLLSRLIKNENHFLKKWIFLYGIFASNLMMVFEKKCD